MLGHLAGQVSSRGKNFNNAIFSDTIYVINVKLCMMVLFIKLYLCIPLSVTFTIFQGHSSVNQFPLKFLCSYLIKLKFDRIVLYAKKIMNVPCFWYIQFWNLAGLLCMPSRSWKYYAFWFLHAFKGNIVHIYILPVLKNKTKHL